MEKAIKGGRVYQGGGGKGEGYMSSTEEVFREKRGSVKNRRLRP